MARNGYLIMDSDLHMMEPDDLWARYLDGPHRREPAAVLRRAAAEVGGELGGQGQRRHDHGHGGAGPGDPGARHAQGATASSRELRRRSRARHPHFQVARARGFDPASTLTAMDIEGIDVAVMYGTRGRQILCHDDLAPDYAAALARAYNNWAARLLQDRSAAAQIRGAARDARRPDGGRGGAPLRQANWARSRSSARRTRSTASICTTRPASRCGMSLSELNVPIGFHPTGNTSLKDDAGRRYVGHANFHPIAHAIRNPVELMGAIASMTTGGVLERHPKLRCAFLEGTAGWLYWWLWRLDDQWEKFGPGCEHQITMLPSEYFKRQCYIALDVDEEPAVESSTRWERNISSCRRDYPHSDGAFPEAIEQFLGLPLDDEQRRKILWDNCARLYEIARPAAPLTREQPQAAAD